MIDDLQADAYRVPDGLIEALNLVHCDLCDVGGRRLQDLFHGVRVAERLRDLVPKRTVTESNYSKYAKHKANATIKRVFDLIYLFKMHIKIADRPIGY